MAQLFRRTLSRAFGANIASGNGMQPPSGFTFLLDADGQYALDADGIPIMETL